MAGNINCWKDTCKCFYCFPERVDIDRIYFGDVFVVQNVLYMLLQVLCIKINTGTKTTLKSDDIKIFVRRNDAQK